VGAPEQRSHLASRSKGQQREYGEVPQLPVAAGETWGITAVAADELLELSSLTCAAPARRIAAGGCRRDVGRVGGGCRRAAVALLIDLHAGETESCRAAVETI
jgi:hypothetical protein